MLALARLQRLCPDLRRVGLSATVEDPEPSRVFLARHPDPCQIMQADPGPTRIFRCWKRSRCRRGPGGGAAYAIPAVLEQIKQQHKTTLIFHNTRAQAEIFFHNLWLANDDGLPIGIHHGSLGPAATRTG